MMRRMDSLESGMQPLEFDSLSTGWSKVSITPETVLPLAGYGARDPMEFEQIHDSVFVRALVFDNGLTKKAIISADLLIIHPEVTRALKEKLKKTTWTLNDILLTATHTHSSLGSWAPGMVGKMFAGAYDPGVVEWLSGRISQALAEAEDNATTGLIGYGELSVPDMIRNRLVGSEGTTDPLLKVILARNSRGLAIHGIYGAHATCLDHNFRDISADYPAAYYQAFKEDTLVKYAGFSAGAVASMGPADIDRQQWAKAEIIGNNLAEQTKLLQMLGPPMHQKAGLRSFEIPFELREPHMKVSKNLILRPWLFKTFVGDYSTSISCLQINDILFIGLPCDFSGELAVQLHQYARSKNLNLIITSFNGGYIGYVPDDRWYDLDKYETRTMSWFGFDNGAYFSEVITRIIDITSNG